VLQDSTVSENLARAGPGGGGTGSPSEPPGLAGTSQGGGLYGLFLNASLGAPDNTVALVNDTVAGNAADTGGGIVVASGTVNLADDTVADNSNTEVVVQPGGTLNAINTIIGDNRAGGAGEPPDLSGTFALAEHVVLGSGLGASGITNGVAGNVVGSDPKLAPLSDNGD